MLLVWEENAGQGGDLEKAQEIRAVRAGEEETAYDTTDRDAIEAFVENCKSANGSWENSRRTRRRASSIPSTGGHRPVGETSTDGSMDKMVELTTYDGSPYVTLHVLGQSLDFEIPQDAAEYLNHPEDIG
ncbi:MAG: hypothetical protein ACLS8R_07090 [Anaeromassilibacillus sp.]